MTIATDISRRFRKHAFKTRINELSNNELTPLFASPNGKTEIIKQAHKEE